MHILMYFTFIEYFILIVITLVKKEPFVDSTAKVIQLHLTVKRDGKNKDDGQWSRTYRIMTQS